MTHKGQKCPLPFHVFTYIFEKEIYVKKGYFYKKTMSFYQNEVKNNEGLDFQNLVFKRSLRKITFIIMIIYKKNICTIYV